MLTVFRNISVIDGTGAEPLRGKVVIIEGGRIRAIEDRWSGKADIDIDGKGKSLLPGLMDMHIHLNIPASPYEANKYDVKLSNKTSATGALYSIDNSRDLIKNGVTTVREVGAHGHGIFALKELIDAGRLLGPRIYSCGRAINMTGGHGPRLSVAADGPDEVRHQARKQMMAGAEILKFMASGAAAEAGESPYDVHLTEAEMAAGVAEARARGATTAAHAVNPQSIINSVNAGIDSIEHGVLADDKSLALMHEKKVHLVPTIWTFQMLAAQGSVIGMENWMMVETKQRVQVHLEVVSKAHKMGIQIAAGTDSALPVNPAASMRWELQWLVHCGLSNLEAIRSATLAGAELLEIEGNVGSIAPGKIADILVVDGDPSTSLEDLARVDVVMRSGNVLVRNGRIVDADRRMISDPNNPPDGPFPPQK
jgi:imidazolonepropionase-like amidohydrolase